MDLHQQLKTSTVYVTHDQTEAMSMADRIVVMNGGHVQQVGRPEYLYAHPANLFVAGFIGSPQSRGGGWAPCAIRCRRAIATSPGSGSAFVRNISAIAWRRATCASPPPCCNEN